MLHCWLHWVCVCEGRFTDSSEIRPMVVFFPSFLSRGMLYNFIPVGKMNSDVSVLVCSDMSLCVCRATLSRSDAVFNSIFLTVTDPSHSFAHSSHLLKPVLRISKLTILTSTLLSIGYGATASYKVTELPNGHLFCFDVGRIWFNT